MVPVKFIVFYFFPLNILNLVLVPGAYSNGHRGTWTGCIWWFKLACWIRRLKWTDHQEKMSKISVSV